MHVPMFSQALLLCTFPRIYSDMFIVPYLYMLVVDMVSTTNKQTKYNNDRSIKFVLAQRCKLALECKTTS